MFQLGGEGDGEVERADAERGGFQVGELGFGETGDEFGAEAVGAAALVDDDEPAGAGERGLDGVEPERRETAQVEEVEAVLVLAGEVVADLRRRVHHLAVGDECGVVARAELPRLPDLAVARVPDDRLLAAAVERLVLEQDHGIAVLVGRQQRVEGVLGRAGIQPLDARHAEERRLELLRVEGAELNRAAGEAEDDGAAGAGAKVKRGGVLRDLREGLGGEVGELELLDRPVAVQREAEGVAGAGALGQRGVEHPGAAELGEEVLGDLERATVDADVLAEQDRLRALGEDLAQRGVDGLGQVEQERRGGRGLPWQRGGDRGEEVRRHAGGIGPGQGEGNADGRLEEGAEFCIDRVEPRGVAGGSELRAEARQRVAGVEAVALARLHVVAGVVGRVAPEPQRVGLDEHGARG